MKSLWIASVLAIAGTPLLAEGAGVYVSDAAGTRIVVAEGTQPSAEALVLIPDPYGEETLRDLRALGAAREPSPLDRRIFTAPQAYSVQPLGEAGGYGVALFGLPPDAEPDLDANGTAEKIVACLGSETLFFAAAEGEDAAPRIVWWAAVPLDYDTDPACSPEMMQAILNASTKG